MLAFSTRRTPVGRHKDAEAAIRGKLDFLDDGLFKRVYVSPDGATVYKLAKGDMRRDEGVSEGRRINLLAEAAWSAYGRKRGVPGIPPVSLYVIEERLVLAMPFYPYDTGAYPRNDPFGEKARDVRNAWDDMGLEDVHGGNWRRDAKRRPFVIDLGGWGTGPLDELPRDLVDRMSDVYIGVDDEDDEDRECEGCGSCTMFCSECDESVACDHCRCTDCHIPWCDECFDRAYEGHEDNHVKPMCNDEDEGWICVLNEGHDEDHQSVLVFEPDGAPFHTWPNAISIESEGE
jgi:hypothetical protein